MSGQSVMLRIEKVTQVFFNRKPIVSQLIRKLNKKSSYLDYGNEQRKERF